MTEAAKVEQEVPRAERTKVSVKMMRIMIRLSMLAMTFSPSLALADVPRPMRLDDLGVSSFLLAYWVVLAFATGMSIVLVTFRDGGMFAEIGWLFFRCGILVFVRFSSVLC